MKYLKTLIFILLLSLPCFASITWQENPSIFSTYDTVNLSAYNQKPVFVDLDDDGDLDLIVGNYYGTLTCFKNVGNSTSPSWEADSSVFSGIDVGYSSAPTFADLDNDGDLDLIIGEEYGTLKYYKNTGNKTAPSWAQDTSIFSGIDVGYNSAPIFADLDNDGDLDLIIGEYYGDLNYYKNTGSNTSPTWSLDTSIFSGIDVGYYSIPTFADLDWDGDLDLVIGENYGYLNYYKNEGSNTWTSDSTMFSGIGYLNNDAPAFADLDGDGYVDLILGQSNGALSFYRNVCSDTFGPSAPVINSINGNGDGSYTISWSEATDPSGVAAYELQESSSASSSILFSDDAEDGSTNWELDGFTLSSSYSHSSNYSFYSGYGNSINYTLTIKNPINISNSTLSFWCRYSIEEDYDYVYIEISTDSINWVSLEAFTGDQYSWIERTYDLSSYSGESIYIRFRYETDSSYYYSGFYVDDITIANEFSGTTLSDNITTTSYNISSRKSLGAYNYRVRAKDTLGNWGSWSSAATYEVALPDEAWIQPTFCYPSPFDPTQQSTNIVYKLDKAQDVKIWIFDMAGRIVWRRFYGSGSAGGRGGQNEIEWNGVNDWGEMVSNGLYLYRIIVDNRILYKGKILVLK